MDPWHALARALTRLRDRRSDGDFRAELEAHIAIEADRLQAEKGLSAEDARFAARRSFGNVGNTHERLYDSRPGAWFDRSLRHLSYAWRGIRRRPVLSAAIVVTLAVGIGFNASLFTLLYSLAFRPLPIRDADRFINVYQLIGGSSTRWVHGQRSYLSYPEVVRYRDGLRAIDEGRRALEATAGYREVSLVFEEAQRKSTAGELVSCDYFATLAVRLTLGRPFTSDECATIGGAPSAIVSYDTWQNDLGGDAAVLGKTITLNRIRFTVVGVAERGYDGLLAEKTRLWIPVTMQPSIDHGRDSTILKDMSWMRMIGRLAPGATVASARAQLQPMATVGDREHPGRDTRVYTVKASYFNSPETRNDGAIAAGVIFALGGLAIGVVCANVMSLLLARGLSRRREIAIRLALGASRRQLIEQLLVESLLLAVFGGGVGFALAYGLPAIIPRIVPPSAPDFHFDLSPDVHVLAFTAILAVLAALVFGLMPALQATKLDPMAAWSDGVIGARVDRPSRLRGAIVGMQVAGSALLLIVGGLLARAVAHGTGIDTGYTTRNAVSFQLNLRELDYDPERARVVLDELARRASAMSVEDVALVTRMPLLGRESQGIAPADDKSGDTKTSATTAASGHFFSALGIKLVAGRAYTDEEARVQAEPPAVVSEAMAKRFWPKDALASAVGRRVRMGRQVYVITGVAANTRYTSLGQTDEPFFYRALPSDALADAHLVIRTRDATTLARLEHEVPKWAAESDQAIVAESERFTARVEMEMFPARLMATAASAVGLLALLLAAIGIYGVVSYAVTQRVREIAIRLALGASRTSVVRLMMQQSGRPAAIGLVAGVLIAAGIAQVMRSALVGVSAFDPITYGAALLVLASAAIVAAYLPSRRAAAVDPGRMLRED